jgi:hypothetical protein
VDGGGGGCRLNSLLVAASLQLLPSSPVVTPPRRLNVLSHSCTRPSCHALAFIRYSSDGQPSLPLHRDACTLSFNVLLCSPRDFVGGGTRLESLGVTIRPDRIGDVFMHSGQMLHGGKQTKHNKTKKHPLYSLLVSFVALRCWFRPWLWLCLCFTVGEASHPATPSFEREWKRHNRIPSASHEFASLPTT